MKQERGVTRIALVITIIMLLVLAAAAIATLTGDNGIFSNEQNARAENKRAEIREKYLLAYNTVRTQILSESTVNGDYHSNSEESSKKLAELVLQDLTGQKQTITDSFTNQEYKADSGIYTVNFTKGNGTENSVIEIIYRDSIFKENGRITALNQNTYPIKCRIIDPNNPYSNCYTANNLKVGDAVWEVRNNTGGSNAWYGDWVARQQYLPCVRAWWCRWQYWF